MNSARKEGGGGGGGGAEVSKPGNISVSCTCCVEHGAVHDCDSSCVACRVDVSLGSVTLTGVSTPPSVALGGGVETEEVGLAIDGGTGVLGGTLGNVTLVGGEFGAKEVSLGGTGLKATFGGGVEDIEVTVLMGVGLSRTLGNVLGVVVEVEVDGLGVSFSRVGRLVSIELQ